MNPSGSRYIYANLILRHVQVKLWLRCVSAKYGAAVFIYLILRDSDLRMSSIRKKLGSLKTLKTPLQESLVGSKGFSN